MAADLRDRLSDLAGATPAGAPPADLWSRGVRRRRVGQAGTALLVAVLVVLVGVGGWTWHTNRVVQPADPGSVTRVPDRLYPPNPWLHAYEGPPGRLIAVLPATRRTFWHEQGGFVGVTASTGRYGFLRLPGMVVNDLTFDAPVSLSPDGQRLAVWVTGPVRGRPHGPTPVAGLDVYDLVTGEVQRWRPPTVHGLSTDTLSWAGGDTLLANFGQWAYGGPSPDGFASGEKTYRWDLPSGQPHPLPRALQGLSSTATPTGW